VSIFCIMGTWRCSFDSCNITVYCQPFNLQYQLFVLEIASKSLSNQSRLHSPITNNTTDVLPVPQSANTVQHCIPCLQLCPRHQSGILSARMCTDGDSSWPCRYSGLHNVATWQCGEQQRNSALAIWNTLPDHLHSPFISKWQFWCDLKTHLFQ